MMKIGVVRLNILCLQVIPYGQINGSVAGNIVSRAAFFCVWQMPKIKITRISPELIFMGLTGSFYIERTVRSSGVVSFHNPCMLNFFRPGDMHEY
jgi:hypothetical protein